MRKVTIYFLCLFMICGLSACGSIGPQDNSEDDSAHVAVVNSSLEDIYGIGYAYYVNGDLYTSGCGCYVDNSAVKVGDKFSLEYEPASEATENWEIEISVVSKSGKEYPCSPRISLDTESGTTCEIEITGDYKDGFSISIDDRK